MKNKILVLLSAFIFCMTLGLKEAMAAAAATDVACKLPCINSFEIQDGQVTQTDIADGAVTNTKIGDGVVTNTKIQDGAVTDAKITGPISSSKIQKPANVVVVAKSGGDFTSIQAAIDSINPAADNPYLIKVMPGTYVENINMKSYIHLQGAGRDVTTIQPSSQVFAAGLSNVTNVTISDFSIAGGSAGGIYSYQSTFTIVDNVIKGNGANGAGNGISNDAYSTAIIKRNIISENAGNGIASSSLASGIIIADNIITGNGVSGIDDPSPDAVIKNNIIKGNKAVGIVANLSSSPTIINNKITNNTNYDIWVHSLSTPNISFNVYDTINGTTGVGQYNVNSDGDLAPAP